MRLSPSLYAADPLHLDKLVTALAPHAGSFHIDVMDGSFAPAFGLGERIVHALTEASPIDVDVHLMVERPGRWARTFAEAGARRVAFHTETTDDPRTIAADIRAAGALAYLALQPTTPLAQVLPLLEVVDGLLLLTAPAGGGAFDDAALHRIANLPPALPKIVDGGLEPLHFQALARAHVDLVVLGRALFASGDIGERAARLKEELHGAGGGARAIES
jgi:ribulose-phosphate 3-epimerase